MPIVWKGLKRSQTRGSPALMDIFIQKQVKVKGRRLDQGKYLYNKGTIKGLERREHVGRSYQKMWDIGLQITIFITII